MDKDVKVMIGITLVIAIIIAAMIGYTAIPKAASVAGGLKDNKAAKEIAAMNIPVTIEELGTDGNGYTVCGQTQWYINGTVAKVILDDDIDPNSYEAHAILYHEMGHAVAIQQGTTADEAAADAYAASKGYNIVDAYHGIH